MHIFHSSSFYQLVSYFDWKPREKNSSNQFDHEIFFFEIGTSPGFSVAATANKLENVGPGQSIVIEIPVPIFSVLSDSK